MSSLFLTRTARNTKQKRSQIPLPVKYKVIQRLNEKVPYKDIMREFGLKNESNITQIKKQKDKIVTHFETGNRHNRLRMVGGRFPAIERKLAAFVRACNGKGIPASKVLLRKTATDISQQMLQSLRNKPETEETAAEIKQLESFTGSSGFIEKFVARNNIMSLDTDQHVEASPPNPETTVQWEQTLKHLISGYAARDVYSADEFGLFFRMLPHYTHAVSGANAYNTNHSKMKLTVLLAANSDGSDKLTPLVIGKDKSPHSLRNKQPPLQWKSSRKSGMTTVLFHQFMSSFNERMVREKRHVLMFVERAASHPKLEMSNVKLMFFPPNTASCCCLQPLDQGIIHCFKSYYRSKITYKILREIEKNDHFGVNDVNVTEWEALNFMAESWNQVTADTISKCFVKSGFRLSDETGEREPSESPEAAFYDVCFDILKQRLNLDTDFNSFVHADDALLVSEANDLDWETDDEMDEASEPEPEEETAGDHREEVQEMTLQQKLRLFDQLRAQLSFDREKGSKLQTALQEYEANLLSERIDELKQTPRTQFLSLPDPDSF